MVRASSTVALQTMMLLRSKIHMPRSMSTSVYGCSVGASGRRLSVAWNSWALLFSDVTMSQ